MAVRRATSTGGRDATQAVVPGRFAISVGAPALSPPAGWDWVRLTEVARLESGHTPSRKRDDYWHGEVPWVSLGDARANHGRVIAETEEGITEEGLANSSARLLPAHTVCLSRTASIGYITAMGCEMATSQDFANWVCSERLHWRFLLYLLLAERDSLQRFSGGSVHPTIYYPELKALHICAPPKQEQLAIAHVLGTLDDKIDSNRRLAGLLEEMASTLFRSWFVDFDPVRAKELGQEPVGMDAEAATLFPDRFEDSTIGRIPGGWSVGRLRDAAEITMGQSPPSSTYSGEPLAESLPLIQGASDLGHRFPEPSRWCASPARTGGAGAILMTVRAPVGRVNIALEEVCLGRGVAAFESDVPGFVEQLVASIDWAGDESGTIFPAVNKKQIGQKGVVVPPEPLIHAFEELVRPFAARIAAGHQESRALAELRDLLLPELISGRLRVKDLPTEVADISADEAQELAERA